MMGHAQQQNQQAHRPHMSAIRPQAQARPTLRMLSESPAVSNTVAPTNTNLGASGPATPADAPSLVGSLDALKREHITLAALVTQQRERVQNANARGLEPVQRSIMERLAVIRELDASRRRIVNELTGSPDTKLEHATSGMAPHHRDAALELGRDLRALIHDIRQQQEVIREAATHLMGHMQGLARTLSQGMSHAGVYGRRGHVEAGATVVSGVDITS